MPKNFYNLPPPWNPGYAIPESVMSEGLQRHAYTTKWAPRGTYDNSTDGTAGYAIPGYVEEEGTGRGTFTTAWLPRGFYGPRIPHYNNRHPLRPNNVVVQNRPLSGLGATATEYGLLSSNTLGPAVPKPPPIPPKSKALQKFGKKASQAVLNKLAKVAPAQRDATFRQMAAQIDPGLYNRTQSEISKATAAGVPASQAFQVGLSSAMTSGFLDELVQIGRTRKVPKKNSVLGALGAVASSAHMVSNLALTSSSPNTNANPGADMIEVGPFRFGVENKPFTLIDRPEQWAALPGTWQRYIRNVVVMGTRDMAAITSAPFGAADAAMQWMQVKAAPTNKVWNDLLRIKPGEKVTLRAISPTMTVGKWSDSDDGRAMPIAQFTHPVSGNKWGVFLSFTGSKENPTGAQLYVKWLPEKPWYDKALSWIADLPAKIIKAAVDVAKAIGGAACDFLSTPGAAAGAAAASGGAAGIGVVVASGICGPQQTALPPVVDTGPSLLTMAALGGGALLAIHLLTKKKKAA